MGFAENGAFVFENASSSVMAGSSRPSTSFSFNSKDDVDAAPVYAEASTGFFGTRPP